MKIKSRKMIAPVFFLIGAVPLVVCCSFFSNDNVTNFVQTSSVDNLAVNCRSAISKSSNEEKLTEITESSIPPLDYKKTLIICCGIIGGLLFLLVLIAIIKYSIIKKRRRIQRQKIRRQVFNDYITLTD